MSEEIWKWIPGYKWKYEASNMGRIRSYKIRGNTKRRNKSPKIKKSWINNGYLMVRIDQKVSPKHVHRLILETFIGPCPEDMECAHLNGNRGDSRLENLKWCSHKENMSHKQLHGTHHVGENNCKAKLKEHEVIKIRKLHALGSSYKEISKMFSVKDSTIYHVVNRASWNHI